MLFPESGLRIWFCRQPADMRKSFNGLSALVKHHLKENPLSGELFVFVNKRKTLMKVLYFEQTGYCIWFKRLEAGVFQLPDSDDGDKIQISYTQLNLILDGIDIHKISQRKRYRYAPATGASYATPHAEEQRPNNRL
jgi:transposase